jgi:hypothetical protein
MKALLRALLLSLVATSAFAAPPQSVMLKRCSFESRASTLPAALEAKKRDLQEIWLTGKEGKKLRMACDFQCTVFCDNQRESCLQSHTNEYCCLQYRECMCVNNCCPRVSCDDIWCP